MIKSSFNINWHQRVHCFPHRQSTLKGTASLLKEKLNGPYHVIFSYSVNDSFFYPITLVFTHLLYHCESTLLPTALPGGFLLFLTWLKKRKVTWWYFWYEAAVTPLVETAQETITQNSLRNFQDSVSSGSL